MLIADLHIHSKYSRATSKEAIPEYLDLWSRRKGIDLVGTGDFTHPAWRAELREKLVGDGSGLYTLRPDAALRDGTALDGIQPRFVVTGEISTIYKKSGRVRKVHSLILLPGLEEAELLSQKLDAIGNIRSDGRPILGLDCRDLLEITLECCPAAVFIPAHIWTPHFSLFGANSGFDSIEECFGDLTPYIHALETGLSSDPPMNWRISALDRYHLISNSDAHSPAKLGREANLLDITPDYAALAAAVEQGKGLAGTIEFFPEEGKYHYDGHRVCKQCLKPSETALAAGLCPVCGRKLTIGVLHRVEQLADRAEGFTRTDAPPFESLVPLPEVIAASTGEPATGVRVNGWYESLLQTLGSELFILRQAPAEDIERTAGPCVGEGIRRLRAGKVERIPGYDGEYGTIQLLDPAEREALNGQVSFFGMPAPKRRRKLVLPQATAATQGQLDAPAVQEALKTGLLAALNQEQRSAATAGDRAVAVVAGPGTGKTGTLAARAAYLVQEKGVKPSQITAVTFTNHAAGELRDRLARELGRRAVHSMTIGTFHGISLELLQAQTGNVRLAGEFEALELAGEILKEQLLRLSARKLIQEVSRYKNGLAGGDERYLSACQAYCARLKALMLLDYDDLLLETLALWEGDVPAAVERRFRHVMVDEVQDLNSIQYRLVKAWNRKGKSLFVIGDQDQSIYGFRGSTADCFAQLRQDWPSLREIRLVQNYRSTPEIMRCCVGLINHNGGVPREIHTVRDSGAPVRLLKAESDLSEGIFIAKEINRLVGGVDMLDTELLRSEETARGFSDFAVLYRTRRQADLIEKCLRREGIPHVVIGRDDFLTDEMVRGALCFFRLLLQPEDTLALRACLRLVWSCPAELILHVERLWCSEAGTAPERLERLPEMFRASRVRGWMELSAQFAPRASREKPKRLLEDWVRQVGCNGSEAMQQLASMAVYHSNMPGLLTYLTLGQEGDFRRSAAKNSYEAGAVSLMTLHGAKGLEFPVVFICGVKQGSIPLVSERREADLEEERRLLYVGMTRAKEELVLLTGAEPSAFLSELPPGAVKQAAASPRRRFNVQEQLSLF